MEDLEGVPVKVGRRTFIVPELTVWAQQQLEKAMPEGDPRGQIDALFDQLLVLLAPNYPELTQEDLKKLVAARRIGEVMKAVAAAAMVGLVAPGEVGRP